MTLLVPDEGEQQLLKYITGVSAQENFVLRLYTNAGPPAEGDTLATYTECSGNGYAAITLNTGGGTWTVGNAAGVSSATAPQQTFTFSGGPVTVKGYYVTSSSTGKVLWAEAFASDANIPAGGGTIKITPKIELA